MAKVAVITGSNGLIGQATCRRLAQSGHLAVGIDVPYFALQWVAKRLIAAGEIGDREAYLS